MSIKKILIVDDTNTDRLFLQDALKSIDCLTITAQSGQEAVEKAKAEKPDLIFMDIIMDEVNGYDACRQIKRDPEVAHIPVIFVSSKHQKADHIWAKKQGGESLIGKPYTKEIILKQLEKQLEKLG